MATIQCYLHTPTSTTLCGPPSLLTTHIPTTDLEPIPYNPNIPPHNEIIFVQQGYDPDCDQDIDWQLYFDQKLGLTMQTGTRAHDSMPAPVAESRVEEPAEPRRMQGTVVSDRKWLEIRDPKRGGSTTPRYGSSGTSPAARAVVGGLGVWVVLGWVAALGMV